MNYYKILMLFSAVVLAHPINNAPDVGVAGRGAGGEIGVGDNGVGVGKPGIGAGGEIGVGNNGIGAGRPGVGVGGEIGAGNNGIGMGRPGIGVGRPGAGVGRPGAGVGNNGIGLGRNQVGNGFGNPGPGINNNNIGVDNREIGVGGSAGVGGGINPLVARAVINSASITDSAVADRIAQRTSIMKEHAQSVSEFRATNTVAEAVNASVAAFTASVASS